MLRVRRVESADGLDAPELAPYRTMRWQYEQRQQGIFVAEGEKVVRRLLESDFEIVSLLIPEKWFQEYSGLLEKRPEPQIEVFTAEKEVLEKLTGFSFYQGVLAVARVPKAVTLEQILERTANQDKPRLFVALDEVSSAANLGGLIRNCVAFDVDALIIGETCCSAWLRRSVRSSMGTIFKLPIVESTSLLESIQELKLAGIRVIAAHAHANERPVSEADFTRDCVVILGSEGHGISKEVLNLCDEQVVIRMKNDVDSLNVGTAGAIFLYEADRQRELD